MVSPYHTNYIQIRIRKRKHKAFVSKVTFQSYGEKEVPKTSPNQPNLSSFFEAGCKRDGLVRTNLGVRCSSKMITHPHQASRQLFIQFVWHISLGDMMIIITATISKLPVYYKFFHYPTQPLNHQNYLGKLIPPSWQIIVSNHPSLSILKFSQARYTCNARNRHFYFEDFLVGIINLTLPFLEIFPAMNPC